MQTIGNLIKNGRLAKNVSIDDLANLTHIRASFISAIEEGQWDKLPNFSVTQGFVKSISHFLDVDENQATSLFRRDYPPELVQSSKLKVKSDKTLNRKFVWGPRLTFLTGVVIIFLTVAIYLGFQYRKFNAPPSLTVTTPVEGQTITESPVEVKGKTDPDVTLMLNNQPVVVNDDGSFDAQVDVNNDTKEILAIAKSRASKETRLSRKIRFQGK